MDNYGGDTGQLDFKIISVTYKHFHVIKQSKPNAYDQIN